MAHAACYVLKGLLMFTTILHVINPDLPSRILADSLDFAFRAILEQKHASGWHPVEYFSKYLTPTEANCSVIECEMVCYLLAI